MRRILVVLAVALVTAAMVVVTAAPAFAAPDPLKEVCQDQWQRYPDFRNQGECISFVNHGGLLD